MQDRIEAFSLIRKLLTVVQIAGVSGETIERALNLEWKDFEDAVQFAAAEQANAMCLVTRNTADYENTEISVMTPELFLEK